MKAAPLFELTGGHPALDLTNTVDNRPGARRKDSLNSCADLIRWSRQAGLLSAGQAGDLSRQARRAPAKARHVLRQAVTLREALYETLSARAAGITPPLAALKHINTLLPEALKRSRIVRRREKFDWEFSASAPSLDRLLWTIGRAAVELLTSDDLALVRECAAADCGWLFLDRSRNRSRRWCEMKVCGNRDKVRRFRRRRGSSH